MASVIKTVAVSLRKGDSAANQAFTGILGELVADLGEDGTGTDINTTLRLHNGTVTGGIPMCRADLANISTSQLASGRENIGLTDEKNLGYADLSNIETLTDSTAIATVLNVLNSYGLAKTTYVDEQIATRAAVDMSNVTTEDLATDGHGHSGKNLAYADTSNINTKNLTSSTIHTGTDSDKPLCYYDFTNANTTNLTTGSVASGPALARKDLTNISGTDINTLLFSTYKDTLKIEQTSNKVNNIYASTTSDQYPTTTAVKTYVASEIENGGFMSADIHNATSYDPLYSNKDIIPIDTTITPNNSFSYKYLVGDDGIITAGSGFSVGHLYTNNFIVDKGTTQSDSLKVLVEEVDDNGIPTTVSFYQTSGMENISGKSPLQIQDEDGNTATITFTSTKSSTSDFYIYTVTNVTASATTCSFTADVYSPLTRIPLTQLLWIKVKAVNASEGITECEILPKFTNTLVEATDFTKVTVNSGTANAVISFKCYTFIPNIGGAGLVKTDLSNLLGMTDQESEEEKNRAWRIIFEEEIPSISEADIADNKYLTIATQGAVWDALNDTYTQVANNLGVAAWKANTAYVTSPKPTIVYYNGALYYCKTAHTSGTSFDSNKWTQINSATYEKLTNKKTDIAANSTSDTYYPTCKATATYVKNQIDNISLPDHYKGQVDNYYATEASLPTTGLTEGYAALLAKYTASGNNYPYVAIYSSSKWTYTQFASGKSIENGNFVYCLDLGETYKNAPGNITWNNNTSALDIAADTYLRPDNSTITVNTSGQIQVATSLTTEINKISSISSDVDTLKKQLSGASIPSPQFFTGTNTSGQVLTISDDIAFDLYVNGVFQYPNTYTYNATTKKITLNFAVQDTTTNGIAVIYKGLKLGS